MGVAGQALSVVVHQPRRAGPARTRPAARPGDVWTSPSCSATCSTRSSAPNFATPAAPLTKGYTADTADAYSGRPTGQKYQIALLLKSTPLGALEQLAVQNELMPPKSTYFFPKLATGMMINPVS